MSKDFEPKLTPEEIKWIQENAPINVAVQNSLGFLQLHRQSGIPVTQIHQESINTTSEENHQGLNSAFNFLKSNAKRFGLSEFTETDRSS